MIRRLYLKNFISFDEVELEFVDGLVVFSGASGAGKSLLMHAILSNFGFMNLEAKLLELELDRPSSMEVEEFSLDDILVLRSIKKERARLYLNGQNISKKRIKEIFKPFIYYLSVRDKSAIESRVLVSLLDNSISQKEPEYREKLESYRERFKIYRENLAELNRVKKNQKEVLNLIEFAKFEIEKIDAIAPKEGEYEELLTRKQRLSKIDKISELIAGVSGLFELEDSVDELFKLLGKDGSYFSEAMNQLRVDFDEAEELSAELLELDIESLLARLESLSSLINRFGSIEGALEYRAKKEQELKEYENINDNKKELQELIDLEEEELFKIAQELSQKRQEASKEIAQNINGYLKSLKLSESEFIFKEADLGADGVDEVDIEINGSAISTLSGGEFNRLRLALMVVEVKLGSKKEGIVFLDEIDANVSGDESIAIANMVKELSSNYQVFAISHQPHLSAKADLHLLISKDSEKSFVERLEGDDERVQEIARMMSGDREDKEALAFAQKLYEQKIVNSE